jgi:uncharacterized protein (TIGR02145 family)
MKQVFFILLTATLFALSCKKENEKGSLATVSTKAAINVTSNSIQSGGDISDDGNSGITKRGIAWAMHTAPTVADSITNDGAGPGSYTTTLSNLNANTTYYLRAYATNASGTAYGNEVSVKTLNGVPTISTTAISDVQPLSAKTGGNVINDGGATISERGIVYSTTADPTITAGNKIQSGTGTGTFNVTLSPLASQQTYYVRAYAINSYGTAYGNQVQFNAASANTVTDVEGNVYSYVTLCGKSWMASNLKVTKYRNGDAIVNGTTGFDWNANAHPSPGQIGAYAFPNYDASKKDSFGLYYNAPAVVDARGICPTGWHVPTDAEWQAIEICQGMSQADANGYTCRGNIAAKFLQNGSSGLNIRLAGDVSPNSTGSPTYENFNQQGVYWASDEAYGDLIIRGFNVCDMTSIYRLTGSKGFSIRCVKD